MITPTFRLIEDSLSHFLKTTCIELTDSNEEFLAVAFGSPPSDYENLELTQYCRLIYMNVQRDRSSHCLFKQYEIDRSLGSDASFVSSLRNKYAHLSGRRIVHSDEQLADILVVRRLVRAVSGLCAKNDKFDDFLIQLNGHVNELLTQVVQVEMPDKFDDEGQNQILGEADRDYIKNAIIEATNIGKMERVASITPSESEEAQLPHILRSELEKFQEKLGTIALIKGRLDGVESAVLSRIEEVLTTTKEIQETISSETEDVEFNEQDDEEDFEDEDVDDAQFGEELDLENSIRFGKIKIGPPLTKNQARDQLITLRKRIWRETGSSASSDGLLRKSMIDNFLAYLPHSEEEAWQGSMGYYLRSVSPTQLPYLNDVCSILRQVKD